MLLKLIRIEKTEVAYLCEVWIVNPLNGDTLVGEVIIGINLSAERDGNGLVHPRKTM